MSPAQNSAVSAARMCRHIGGRRYAVRLTPQLHHSNRSYASSTKPANASAAQALKTAPAYTPPPFPFPKENESSNQSKSSPSISRSLPSRIPLTMLPTPLPLGESSPLHTHFFPDSSIQHTFSVMDALLRDGYDVPRAARMFDSVRKLEEARSTIDVELYNSFLGAYLTEALKETVSEQYRAMWLAKLWELFAELVSDKSKWIVRPNRESFSIALLALVKFSAASSTPVTNIGEPTGESFLRLLLEQHVLIYDLMRSPLLQLDLDDCNRFLRVAALDSGRSDIAMELGKAMADAVPDELEGIPDVKPVSVLTSPTVMRGLKGQVIKVIDRKPTGGEETPYNLQSMRDYLGQVKLGRASLPDDPTARQRLMEESAYLVAAARWRHEAEKLAMAKVPGWNIQRTKLRKWMYDWYEALKERLENEIPTLQDQEKRSYTRKLSNGLTPADGITPFLRVLSVDKLATMTITELLRNSVEDGAVRTTRAAVTLGRAVELEYDAEIRQRAAPDLEVVSVSTEGGLAELAATRQKAREQWKDTHHAPAWTQVARAKVGCFLLDALLDVAVITRTGVRPSTGEEVSEQQPAFAHRYQFSFGRKIGIIKFNDEVIQQMSSEPVRDALHPRQLPMLIPPRPWIDVEKGGYMYSRTPVMRYKDSLEQSAFLRSASSAGHLESMYAALDVLGSTPWTINKPVFDVVLKVWNDGQAIANLPAATVDVQDPPRPENFETDVTARKEWIKKMAWNIQKRQEHHSIRCDINYKLEIGRAFLGERFYFPHNVDFRGRAYPVPPNLNHMGDDLCRGILTFADKKTLGPRGLRWLKIHVANKYGYDKASLEERVNWTMEHLDDIFDSATQPLEGKRWWLKADDPWQCLAACVELYNALQLPNPETFESSLPVHQDGTCNGLQHYAALGGDGQGARQVNLDVAERPADVYTFIADMVERRLDEAAEKGDEKAKKLRGRIARKVVKQTVMTTVYGVTFLGAREQIRRQLEDIPGFLVDEEEGYSLAVYVTRLTLACIGDLFSGAKSIQLWLNQVARLISKSIPPERIEMLLDEKNAPKVKGVSNIQRRSLAAVRREQMTSMIWTTPLGMPVVQPYRKQAKKQILTALQTIFIADPNLPLEVNARKQATAFPPNFIHSLDATHMMLTALGCRDKQLTFASVHDSYWSHAASIDEMSATIRETFVKLHGADILGNLLMEIRQRYKDYKVPVAIVKDAAVSPAALAKRRARAAAKGIEQSLADGTVDNSAIKKTDFAESVDASQMDQYADNSVELAIDMSDSGGIGEEEEVTLEEEDAPQPKKKGSARSRSVEDTLRTRFVNVVDVLPPLPAKGEFNIEKIKDSLYFFS